MVRFIATQMLQAMKLTVFIYDFIIPSTCALKTNQCLS